MGIIAPVCGRYLPTGAQPSGVAVGFNTCVTGGWAKVENPKRFCGSERIAGVLGF